MLVLGRNVGQSIEIGEDIVITIVSARNGKIRLGIMAPGKRVVRSELVPVQDCAPVFVDVSQLPSN